VREEFREPVVPLEERRINQSQLGLFNTITTSGTPPDVKLQELRIKMSFPADQQTEATLRDWAD
jgi:hypothetical protein